MKSEKYYKIRNLILLFVYGALLGLAAKIYVDFGGIDAPGDKARHISQAALVAMVILTVLCFRAALGLFPREKYERAAKRIKKAISRIAVKIYDRIVKFAGKLGLGSRKKYVSGEDEYSFLFDEDDKKRKKLSMAGIRRWEDSLTNGEKIRFLFTRYMIAKIRRGFHNRRGKTHTEWCEQLSLEGDERALFSDYGAARYGGGREHIPDSSVARAQYIVNRRKKKE